MKEGVICTAPVLWDLYIREMKQETEGGCTGTTEQQRLPGVNPIFQLQRGLGKHQSPLKQDKATREMMLWGQKPPRLAHPCTPAPIQPIVQFPGKSQGMDGDT